MKIDIKDVKVGDYIYWINSSNSNHYIFAKVLNNGSILNGAKTFVLLGKTIKEFGHLHGPRIGYEFGFSIKESTFYSSIDDINKLMVFK